MNGQIDRRNVLTEMCRKLMATDKRDRNKTTVKSRFVAENKEN
jgi:hypothetical protein